MIYFRKGAAAMLPEYSAFIKNRLSVPRGPRFGRQPEIHWPTEIIAACGLETWVNAEISVLLS